MEAGFGFPRTQMAPVGLVHWSRIGKVGLNVIFILGLWWHKHSTGWVRLELRTIHFLVPPCPSSVILERYKS